MLNNRITEDENPEIAEFAKLLETSPQILFCSSKVELLQDVSRPSSDWEKAPEVG